MLKRAQLRSERGQTNGAYLDLVHALQTLEPNPSSSPASFRITATMTSFTNVRSVSLPPPVQTVSPLQLRPNHESVHGPLDVIGCVLFGLKSTKRTLIASEKCISISHKTDLIDWPSQKGLSNIEMNLNKTNRKSAGSLCKPVRTCKNFAQPIEACMNPRRPA